MKILVTGKNGQVGHELVHSLKRFGEVIALDRSQMDLTNVAQIRDVIRSVGPDMIVNPAAYTAVDLAETEQSLSMQINGEAPDIIAQEARKCGAAMIHYSTDYVFDGTKSGPYVEADPGCPISQYGRSKLAGEEAVTASGVPHLILRTSWVYGLHGKNFFKTIQRLAGERDVLSIVSDQYGAPTWAKTIAEGTAMAIDRLCKRDGCWSVMPEAWAKDGGVVHLTAQGSTSWHGFASEIVARGSRARVVEVTAIPSSAYPTPAQRPQNSILSSALFQDRFGPLPDWQSALAACLIEQRELQSIS
jgi:dTDP-4-dehydrorhamnose reductase